MFITGSAKMWKQLKIFFDGQINTENQMHTHTHTHIGTLFNFYKKENRAICNNIDVSRKLMLNEIEARHRKRKLQYLTYMWNLKQSNYKTREQNGGSRGLVERE